MSYRLGKCSTTRCCRVQDDGKDGQVGNRQPLSTHCLLTGEGLNTYCDSSFCQSDYIYPVYIPLTYFLLDFLQEAVKIGRDD